MFAGEIDHQTIIANYPVLVLDGKSFVNSFARIEEATDFLYRTGSETAVIYRHTGVKWDKCPSEAQ